MHLVATLLSLNRVIPARTRETARRGRAQGRRRPRAAARAAHARRRVQRRAQPRVAHPPAARLAEIDWDRTIRANLRHYQPDLPHDHPRDADRLRPPAAGRRCARSSCASTRAARWPPRSSTRASSAPCSPRCAPLQHEHGRLRHRVVDLTDELHDPVELLFGTQLGGGTDINRALAYCQRLVQRPRDTILVLISDLFEGGDQSALLRRVAGAGGERASPSSPARAHRRGRAGATTTATRAAFAALGVPAFACTPDLFPELMAAAIERRDIGAWAAREGRSVQFAADASAAPPPQPRRQLRDAPRTARDTRPRLSSNGGSKGVKQYEGAG